MRLTLVCPFPAQGSSPDCILWKAPWDRSLCCYLATGCKNDTGLAWRMRGYLRNNTTVRLHELSRFWAEQCRLRDLHEYQLVLEARSWKFNDIISGRGHEPSASQPWFGRAATGTVNPTNKREDNWKKIPKSTIKWNPIFLFQLKQSHNLSWSNLGIPLLGRKD